MVGRACPVPGMTAGPSSDQCPLVPSRCSMALTRAAVGACRADPPRSGRLLALGPTGPARLCAWSTLDWSVAGLPGRRGVPGMAGWPPAPGVGRRPAPSGWPPGRASPGPSGRAALTDVRWWRCARGGDGAAGAVPHEARTRRPCSCSPAGAQGVLTSNIAVLTPRRPAAASPAAPVQAGPPSRPHPQGGRHTPFTACDSSAAPRWGWAGGCQGLGQGDVETSPPVPGRRAQAHIAARRLRRCRAPCVRFRHPATGQGLGRRSAQPRPPVEARQRS